MTLTLPSVTFDPTKTVFGTKAIGVFTPTTGSPVNFLGKVLELDYSTKVVERKVPGTDNVNRNDRQAVVEADESFTFVDIEEIDTVLTAMGGFTGVNKTGTMILWICDQDDVTGTSVREKSNSFKCSITVKSGKTTFGGGKFSMTSLLVTSIDPGPVVFTPNATS